MTRMQHQTLIAYEQTYKGNPEKMPRIVLKHRNKLVRAFMHEQKRTSDKAKNGAVPAMFGDSQAAVDKAVAKRSRRAAKRLGVASL